MVPSKNGWYHPSGNIMINVYTVRARIITQWRRKNSKGGGVQRSFPAISLNLLFSVISILAFLGVLGAFLADHLTGQSFVVGGGRSGGRGGGRGGGQRRVSKAQFQNFKRLH